MLHPQTTENQIRCFHCGDRCDDGTVTAHDKQFCCTGCQTVFEILSDSDLLEYYSLESNPGVSWKTSHREKYFDFLTNPEIEQRLLDFSSPSLKRITLFIPAIHCSSCIWLLENLHRLQTGIVRTKVNFPLKEFTVDFQPDVISLAQLVYKLGEIGYDPVITLDSAENKNRRSGQPNFYLKLGIAGFSFANIMLLSFPEYLGLSQESSPDIGRFISLVILGLSIPVIAYSAIDYYRSAWQGLKQGFINIDIPISLGILTLFGRSLIEILSQSGPGYLDSLSGLVFFLLIGRWYQNQTYQGLAFDRDYKSFFPLAVTLVKETSTEQCLVQNLKPGDTILIRNKELVPCDSQLTSSTGRLDYSFVTGESEVQIRKQGDIIYAGGRPVGSALRFTVQKEVSQSILTSLWNNQVFDKHDKDGDQLFVNQISKYFTLVVIGLAFAGLAVWLPRDTEQAVLVFSAVLIVACPCALALAAPFTLGSTMRIFGHNHFFLKNTTVIEKLTRITTVIFDKTGTITSSGNNVRYHGSPLNRYEQGMVASLTDQSTHPLSHRIHKAMQALDLENGILQVDNFEEIEGQGIQGSVGGHKIRLGSNHFAGGDHLNGSRPDTSSHVYLSIDGASKGAFLVGHRYRDNLKLVNDRLSQCFKLGLISGDHQGERNALSPVFPAGSELNFGMSPSQKLDYVRAQQDTDQKILYCGDGLNDAGALRESYVGIAINENVASFTPSSDAILLGRMFDRLPDFLAFARMSRKVVMASFGLSFLYNAFGLTFALTGNLTPLFAAILMPLSSVTVVLFATTSVRLLAARQKLL